MAYQAIIKAEEAKASDTDQLIPQNSISNLAYGRVSNLTMKNVGGEFETKSEGTQPKEDVDKNENENKNEDPR